MYNTDVRVANTASPSFNSNPNVTQYGWTGSDQGHYNQLIQYVDECRKIWQDLSEKIDYVEGLLGQVASIDEQVRYVTQKANEVAEDTREVKTAVAYIEIVYNRINAMTTSFDIDYKDFTTKYDDFVIKYEDVLLNASNAEISATEAHKWYEKSYDLYLDLKNGQVYRGTWNPNTGNFPSHGDTNSVWDVVLDDGQSDHPYGGFTWHNGDRLLYVLADKKYDQLRTGSGVLSVNGKTGAVTLVPSDIGALGANEPSVSTARFTKPVKIAGKEFDGSGDLDIEYYDVGAPSKFITVNGQSLQSNVHLGPSDVGAIAIAETEPGSGLVMRVGGERDRAIQAALADATGGAYMAETPPANPIPGARWFDTNDGRTYLYYVDGDSSQWIEENPQSPDIIQTSPIVQKLANDLILDSSVTVESSLPITGGTVNGGITVRDGITITGTGVVQEMVGGSLRCNTDQVMSMDGKTYSFVTSTNDAHLCHNAYWDGTAWRKYDNTKPSGYFVVRDTGLQYMVSNAGETDPASHRFEVLSTRNTGFVPLSSVFTLNTANGWIQNDAESVCRTFPGGVHIEGILRRTPGQSIGDKTIGWFAHHTCNWAYSPILLSSTDIEPPLGILPNGYIERGTGTTNLLLSNALTNATGWIMINITVQFV